MDFVRIVDYADDLALLLSLVGVLVITIGVVQALGLFVKQLFAEAGGKGTDYERIRGIFSEKILLALDFFIAADIIRTIVTPTFTQLGILAGIVGIRIVLSYFLGKEAARAGETGGGSTGES
ncbi:MAG: DUF1622 domain-containing protein [Candidatus Aquicultorales bacterium]